MNHLFAFRFYLPRFITNNPYFQIGMVVLAFVGQFFALKDLYKTVRLKKWRDLNKLDKFYKILNSFNFSLFFFFGYYLIYILDTTRSESWFILGPGLVYVFIILPRSEKQSERIDKILMEEDPLIDLNE